MDRRRIEGFLKQRNVLKHIEVVDDFKSMEQKFNRFYFVYCDQNVHTDDLNIIGTIFQPGQSKPLDFHRIIKNLKTYDILEQYK